MCSLIVIYTGILWDILSQNNIDFAILKFISSIIPFPNNKILDPSKLREFADDNFKFDDNGRKFSKRVGKGKIAHYELFLLFSQCVWKTFNADT